MNHHNWLRAGLAAGALCAAALAWADGDDWLGGDRGRPSGRRPDATPAAPATVPFAGNVALVDHPGRLLASNCFQCHGTDGRNGGFDRLAGEPARELMDELVEMRGERDEDEAIMRVHALAYTDEQLRLLADYFARLGR